ncbi:MAG: hypothetical protein EOS76_33960 [Mesorhizobium sp.]|nr:MAG: hypothetical protein EOS76_33960 [Mesorhizobium sp.]
MMQGSAALADPPNFASKKNNATVSTRIHQAESRLKPTAENLKKIIAEQIEARGSDRPNRRKGYLEIFEATVPDPAEFGLTME